VAPVTPTFPYGASMAVRSSRHQAGPSSDWGYWPTRPSIRSRSRSAWPRWRAYSSTMWSITSRSAAVVPSCMGVRTARSGDPATNCSAKATSSCRRARRQPPPPDLPPRPPSRHPRRRRTSTAAARRPEPSPAGTSCAPRRPCGGPGRVGTWWRAAPSAGPAAPHRGRRTSVPAPAGRRAGTPIASPAHLPVPPLPRTSILRRIHPHAGLRANRVPAFGYHVPGALLRHSDQPFIRRPGWPAE